MEFDDFPYIGNRFTPTDELHHLSEGDENDPESVGVNSGINRALSENVGKSMQKPIPSIPTPFNILALPGLPSWKIVKPRYFKRSLIKGLAI